MNTDETISAFITFFRDRGHQPVASSSLLSPPGDPVLFTTAGMHPLTPYLAGQPHPLGRRLVGVQRCLRTTDLDEVATARTWTGDGPPSGSPGTDARWLELWNHVTMSYERRQDGSLTPARQPSVDTGMGLERLLMVAQQAHSIYETDLFRPWLSVLPSLWPPPTMTPSQRRHGKSRHG